MQVEAALRLLDRDGNGVIDKEEFTNWWLSRGTDLDGDGACRRLCACDLGGACGSRAVSVPAAAHAVHAGIVRPCAGKVSEIEAGLGRVALAGSNDAVRGYIEKIREDRDTLNRFVHRPLERSPPTHAVALPQPSTGAAAAPLPAAMPCCTCLPAHRLTVVLRARWCAGRC